MIDIRENKRKGKYVITHDREIVAELSLIEIQAIADYFEKKGKKKNM